MHCHVAWTHTLVPTAVLTASLLGSGHCAFMCGGLVTAAAKSRWQQFFYHSGRLLSYTALGWISGWIGGNAVLHLPAWFSEGIAWAVGISFIILGIAGWRGSWHLSIPGASLVNRWVVHIFQVITNASGSQKALYSGLIGALSIFLPCGWLYGFVLAALSTANPLHGVYLMFVFWIGTIPALTVSPWIIRKIFSLVKGFAPKLASVLLVLAGILPILFRYVSLR